MLVFEVRIKLFSIFQLSLLLPSLLLIVKYCCDLDFIAIQNVVPQQFNLHTMFLLAINDSLVGTPVNG